MQKVRKAASPKVAVAASDEQEFATVREIARAWKVSPWTVRRYISQGRIKVHRFGDHTVRISHEEKRRFEQEAAANA